MHMIVTLKDPPKGIIRTAHQWIVATGGADKFSFDLRNDTAYGIILSAKEHLPTAIITS